MTRIQKITVAVVAVVAVGGAGAAVAATKLGSPQEESKAVVNDAAKQLGVTPERLTIALKTALKNRVDAAVKAGRMTKAEGDALKARIDENAVPLLGPGRGRFGHGGPGHHGPGHLHGLNTAAKYLGMTEASLRTALEGGKTLAQVAKDRDKSVDGLVDALVADKRDGIDQAVKDGKLTRAEADEFLSGLKARVTDMVNGRFAPRFGRGFRGGDDAGARPAFAPAF
jgi:polyhydroxyalkanoate synthesis regulator phasin